uniref:CUB_2 domain-containing protein n=1 Tax=Caenorhabditis tropicalis TaxID=1561998 RepID=A0A1I7UDW7_9PELO
MTCYQCQNDIINPPLDLSQSTYYPLDWSEDQPIPTVSAGQACVITVNVPTRYYANVTFYRQFPYATGSYALYSNNKVVRIENNDPNPFFFVSPQFKVNLQTVNSTAYTTKFAFKIVWTPLPTVSKRNIMIEKNSPPVAVFPSAYMTTFIGDQGTQLSLMAFSLADSANSYFLRQSAIYAGDTVDAEFIGTLDQVLTSRYPLTARGNKISVLTFDLGNYFYCPLFMSQATSDVRGYQVYLGRNCEDQGPCTVTLDGSLGNSLTVTEFDGSETIQGFRAFPESAVINVYENTVSMVTRVAQFNATNYQEQLPFKVNGFMKFYELIGTGMYDMIVTHN